MFRAVQKVVLNGKSAQVTLARPLLFALNLRPGDFVELIEDERGGVYIRPWFNHETGRGRGPGQIAPEPPEVLR